MHFVYCISIYKTQLPIHTPKHITEIQIITFTIALKNKILRLLPCPGYYKQCCDEHWGTRVSFPSGFLSVYAQQWDCWIIRHAFVVLLRNN